ncbi:MAG: class I SAM-dependent methyltransferase [Nocardioidaceae bacterium]
MTSISRPIFARFYAKLSRQMEVELGQHRHALLEDLSGSVLEVGCGNGLNFSHYPASVVQVTAIEPEPHLRRLAVAEASRSAVPIEVMAGVAEDLPVADAAFDAVVTTLVLCSVRDPAAAVDEIRRVLRPGGEFRFLEHVRADTSALGMVQRVADATVWPLFVGGCHTHRDTAAAIRRAGLNVTELRSVRFPDLTISTPTTPHILGTATIEVGR